MGLRAFLALAVTSFVSFFPVTTMGMDSHCPQTNQILKSLVRPDDLHFSFKDFPGESSSTLVEVTQIQKSGSPAKVATLKFSSNRGTAYVEYIGVEPQFRNHGIQDLLYRKMVDDISNDSKVISIAQEKLIDSNLNAFISKYNTFSKEVRVASVETDAAQRQWVERFISEHGSNTKELLKDPQILAAIKNTPAYKTSAKLGFTEVCEFYARLAYSTDYRFGFATCKPGH